MTPKILFDLAFKIPAECEILPLDKLVVSKLVIHMKHSSHIACL